MSSRGRIKCKVVESTINNRDVLDMFNEVLGTGEKVDLNLAVVHPKYLSLKNHCQRFIRLLEALAQAPCMAALGAHLPLRAYLEPLRAQLGEVFSAPDLAAAYPPSPLEAAAGRLARYEEVSFEEYTAFAEKYRPIKNCGLINAIVVTVKNLLPHKGSLQDPQKLRDRFLKSPGSSFAPFPDLPELNFKKLYISDLLSAADRSFLLMVLHKVYAIGHDVYDVALSPDVDVQQFVQVILASLEDVKKAIPRCGEAFDKIRESVGLLEGNFDGYWKDCVASGNPTLMMENFVLDVSRNTRASPRITGQFRRIINFYREQAKTKAHNPKLQSLFQQVDLNFQELERQTRDAPEGDEGSSSSSAEDVAGDDSAGGSAGGAPGGSAQGPAPRSKAQKRAARRRKQRAAASHSEPAEAGGETPSDPPGEAGPGPLGEEGPGGETPSVPPGEEGPGGVAREQEGPDVPDGDGPDGEEEDTRPPEEAANDAEAGQALEAALGL